MNAAATVPSNELDALFDADLPCSRLVRGGDEHGPATWRIDSVKCISKRHVEYHHNVCDQCIKNMREWSSRPGEWVCPVCGEAFLTRSATWTERAL
ncbi:hypothetical protein FK268_09315 [Tsukamurella sputi]|uniref:Uncharacterized protein n=1 Tax=Tsukamurella sputi TaxID=2591848 RepID=A0A5C5RQM0_9ACTN|nr:hypothetical protein [Tsukamurella sputi]TWS25379.1 hypothetical protein FK268_09315 [Tsukamurella sputi]